MRKLRIASAVALGLLASGAFAAKLSITGSVVESLTASDNLFLANKSPGAGYESVSTLNLSFLSKTPTTSYRLDTNAGYFSYGGPGSVGTSLKTGTPYGFNFAIDHSTDALTNWNLHASWQRADLAAALLAQTGQATARGYSDTALVGGGITRELTALDSITFSGTATKTSFTSTSGTPSQDLLGVTTWRHKLTPNIALTTSVSGDWYSEDDVSGTERLFWNASESVEIQLSRLLSVHGRYGEVFVNYWSRNGGTPSIDATLPIAQGGAGHAPVWDAGLDYSIDPTTRASVGIAQAITPTVLGNLQQSTSYQASVSRTINSHTSAFLSGQFAQLTDTSGNSDLLSVSAGISYSPAREYHSNLTYTFTQRTDSTGKADSNTVVYTLTRDLNILP